MEIPEVATLTGWKSESGIGKRQEGVWGAAGVKVDQVFERNLAAATVGASMVRFHGSHEVDPGGELSGAAPRTRLALHGGSRFTLTSQEVPRSASLCPLFRKKSNC